MNNLELNETPVRTAKNFNINSIKLDNVDIPNKINSFNNVEILGETSKIKIEQLNKSNTTYDLKKECPNGLEVQENNCNLTYGLGKEFLSQIKEQANQKIKLTIDSKTNKEIQINFKFDKEDLTLVENIEIIANENTSSTIILKYESKKDIEAYHNGIIKLLAKNNSNVNVILINLMNEKSNNFLAIENKLEENASVKYTIVDFGGKNSITNYYSNLIGDNSNNILNTIYLGKENQLFDLNYIAELRGKKCNIDIDVQGALKDFAKKHFKGTIDFKKGCKKSIGNENEACMILSDTAKSIALPMLLCSEEEVEGNHSSSAGKIGEKELFYIMSRGFELKEAMKLMVRARFNKILNNIKNEELKEKVLNEIDMRLD